MSLLSDIISKLYKAFFVKLFMDKLENMKELCDSELGLVFCATSPGPGIDSPEVKRVLDSLVGQSFNLVYEKYEEGHAKGKVYQISIYVDPSNPQFSNHFLNNESLRKE